MSAPPSQFLLLRVNGGLYALGLPVVEKVVPMAWLERVTESPDDVRGVVDVHGRLVAVIDPAGRLGQPPTPARVSDFIVLLALPGVQVGFKVDEVVGLEQGLVVPPNGEAHPPAFLQGHLRTPHGLASVLDADLLLHGELRSAAEALGKAGAPQSRG